MKKWIVGVLMLLPSLSFAYGTGVIDGYSKLDSVKPILLAQADSGLSAANNSNPAPQFPNIPFGPWKANIGKGWAIGLNLNYDIYLEGARDYDSGQWLGGWGKEISPLTHNGTEVAYVSLYNLYNADEKGKGVVGAAIGSRPIGLINTLANISGIADKLIPTPTCAAQCDGLGQTFLKDVSEYSSIELGGGYRAFNSSPGVARLALTIGGQVNIPLSDFFKHQ